MRRIQLSSELVEACFREGASSQGQAIAVTDGLPEGCRLIAASLKGGVLILDFAEPGDPPGRPGELHLVMPHFHGLVPVPPGTVLH